MERVRCYQDLYQRHIWQTLSKFWRLYSLEWNILYKPCFKSMFLIEVYDQFDHLAYHFISWRMFLSWDAFKFVDLTKVLLLYVYGLCLCFKPFVYIFMVYFWFIFYMLFIFLYPIHIWFLHNLQNLNHFSSFFVLDVLACTL